MQTLVWINPDQGLCLNGDTEKQLLCPDCKAVLTGSEREQVYGKGATVPDRPHYRPVGCERCYYTGYWGRWAIYEVIPIDGELAEAVRESRPDIAPLLRERGITTLKDSALDLFLSGQTSLEEVLPLLRE